jgi:hypothetical protein
MTSPSGLVTTGITNYVSTGASNPTTLQQYAAPATYVAPNLVATPACASGPASSADSAACQQQIAAAQNQNFALSNQANYNVDLANCQSAWTENAAAYTADGITPPPNTCAQNTYGLTILGTGDSTDELAPNAQFLVTGTNPAGTTPPATNTGSGGGSGTPSFAFTNLTGGNNSVFNVGDQWQIQISGAAPNAAVVVSGGQNGANGSSQMGTTDSNGNFPMHGQMTAAEVGPWQETWTVGGKQVASFSYTVNPTGSASGTGTGTGTGGSVTGSFSDLLNASTTVAGTSIPDWAIAAAVVVGLFLVMKK